MYRVKVTIGGCEVNSDGKVDEPTRFEVIYETVSGFKINVREEDGSAVFYLCALVDKLSTYILFVF